MTVKVLLADPNPTTRKVVELTLANEDAEFIGVSGSREALASAESRRPDVILFSESLDDQGVLNFCQMLSENDLLSEVPLVVLISGRKTSPDQLKEWGLPLYLEKPFEAQELIDKIDEAVSSKAEAEDDETILAEESDSAATSDPGDESGESSLEDEDIEEEIILEVEPDDVSKDDEDASIEINEDTVEGDQEDDSLEFSRDEMEIDRIYDLQKEPDQDDIAAGQRDVVMEIENDVVVNPELVDDGADFAASQEALNSEIFQKHDHEEESAEESGSEEEIDADVGIPVKETGLEITESPGDDLQEQVPEFSRIDETSLQLVDESVEEEPDHVTSSAGENFSHALGRHFEDAFQQFMDQSLETVLEGCIEKALEDIKPQLTQIAELQLKRYLPRMVEVIVRQEIEKLKEQVKESTGDGDIASA